jgi:N-acyl-D-amino-acid deacylase
MGRSLSKLLAWRGQGILSDKRPTYNETMNRKTIVALILACAVHYPILAYGAETESTYDLWIRSGSVVDGSGRERVQADVLIRADTIAFVGAPRANVQARRTIDARGKVVTPGFIDTHGHGDPLTDSFTNFLAQGITTVVLGQDGSSPGSGDQPVPLAEWMRRVQARGSEVNIATFSGHGTLRTLAGVGEAPKPTDAQLRAMQDMLRADLNAGAYGLSFGLEYSPGRYSQVAETKALGDVAGRHGGIVMSHMRTEDSGKIAAALDELLHIDAPLHVSHVKIVSAQRLEEAKEVLDRLERARAQGKRVTADVYPYLASVASFQFLYPDWARRREDYDAAVRERRADLEQHLRKRVRERNGPKAILFTAGQHAGKTLADLAVQLNKPYEKVIIDDVGYVGPAQAHFHMSPAVQGAFITADHVSICTDGSPGSAHPRSYDSFVKVLDEYVGAPPKMSFERAVHKMSGLPATILGVDRGLIVSGRKADILVLDPKQLDSRATFTEPTLAPRGVDFVIVNGAVAFEQGAAVGKNGRMLRRTSE